MEYIYTGFLPCHPPQHTPAYNYEGLHYTFRKNCLSFSIKTLPIYPNLFFFFSPTPPFSHMPKKLVEVELIIKSREVRDLAIQALNPNLKISTGMETYNFPSFLGMYQAEMGDMIFWQWEIHEQIYSTCL